MLAALASVLLWQDPSLEERLWAAAAAGEVDVIQSLVAVGADVTAANEHRETAFDLASDAGHVEVMVALLFTPFASNGELLEPLRHEFLLNCLH